MVTEKQRLAMLNILSVTLINMDRIQEELKKNGIDMPPEEIQANINKLKAVRGSR